MLLKEKKILLVTNLRLETQILVLRFWLLFWTQTGFPWL